MRLTLRTLMAWMDDTLPPKDVRRIGRQLERSKFSQDLSRRIRRVVRQRRLTVPGMGSNQPVDANVVAAYLDNNLPPEHTGAFESLCLNSDVHLAEVAASHQILSVLEQSPRISPECYSAMYRLVKAPEARVHADRNLPSSFAEGLDGIEQGTIASDEAAWPAPTFHRNVSRFMTLSLGLALTMILGNLTLDRLSGPKPTAPIIRSQPLPEPSPDDAPAIGILEAPIDSVVDAPAISLPNSPTPDTRQPADAAAPVEKAAEKEATGENIAMRGDTASKKAAEPEEVKRVPAAGNVAARLDFADLVEPSASSLLFVESVPGDANTEWLRLTKSTKAQNGQIRFGAADPLRIEKSGLTLAIESATLIAFEKDSAPEIRSGTIEFQAASAASIAWKAGAVKELILSCPAESRFVLERVNALSASTRFSAVTLPETVEIRALAGEVRIRIGAEETLLQSGRSARMNIGQSASPTVSVNESPSDMDSAPADSGTALTTRTMSRYLSANRPLPTAIIDAEADELVSVRDLAMRTALWIGRQDIVSGVLTDLDNPALRESAVRALRRGAVSGDAQVGLAFAEVVQELELQAEDAILLDSLLKPPAATVDFARKRQLVDSLQHDARLIRQLALEHLMKCSGRDSLGYDPDAPTLKGLEAWRMWLGAEPEDDRP